MQCNSEYDFAFASTERFIEYVRVEIFVELMGFLIKESQNVVSVSLCIEIRSVVNEFARSKVMPLLL